MHEIHIHCYKNYDDIDDNEDTIDNDDNDEQTANITSELSGSV